MQCRGDFDRLCGDTTMPNMKSLGTGSRASLGVVALLGLAATIACSRQQEAPPATTTNAVSSAAADAPIPSTSSPLDALPEDVRTALERPFTADFDEMIKRRMIRVGVTFNRTHY